MADWYFEEVGLEVPGLGRAKRDAALKAAALRLLDEGFRALLKQAYNLAPGVPAAERLRPKFATIGPAVKAAFKEYLQWYQRLAEQTDGTLVEAWGEQLAEYRGRYDELRAQVKAAGGEAPPGSHLYQPPKPGESWADWLRKFPTSSGAAFGLVVGIGLVLWLRSQKGR